MVHFHSSLDSRFARQLTNCVSIYLVLSQIAMMADGDARAALNLLELCVRLSSGNLSSDGVIIVQPETLKHALQRTHLLSDKAGEEHYNLISALHKSIRGSDCNASLYWMARLLEGGEDPLYIARRLVRAASEDIGLADPLALVQAVSAFQACHLIGKPECNVILAQVVAYLARAPKSNSLYVAYENIKKVISEEPNLPVPLHLRNASTKLMKDLGYGKDYKYNPDYNYVAEQSYLPECLQERKFFEFKSS